MKGRPSLLRMKMLSHVRRQSGYVLLIIMLALALLMIGMLAAAPSITTQIKRDREQEMIHRGQQYAIAVKRYYKKFGRYPVKIEDLENSNNMRFLRRAYKNPTDPKGDWRLLHLGEVKTVLAMPGVPGAQPVGTPAGAMGGIGAAGALGGAIGAQPQTAPQGGPQSPQGTDQGQPGSPIAGSQPAAGTTTGGPQVFGGGPIVGVAGTVEKPSIIAWHDKTSYKDWEFFYDPRLDVNLAASGAPGGNPAAAAGANPNPAQPTGATPNPMGPGPEQPPPMPPDQGPK